MPGKMICFDGNVVHGTPKSFTAYVEDIYGLNVLESWISFAAVNRSIDFKSIMYNGTYPISKQLLPLNFSSIDHPPDLGRFSMRMLTEITSWGRAWRKDKYSFLNRINFTRQPVVTKIELDRSLSNFLCSKKREPMTFEDVI